MLVSYGYPLAALLVGFGIPSTLSQAMDGDTQLAVSGILFYGGVLLKSAHRRRCTRSLW